MKFIILVFAFVAATTFAGFPEPAWLNQIKLSGINGPPGQRLATINGKNFAAGEDYDVKLNGRTVHVQCLQIFDQSVLVKLQDLPATYGLSLGGGITVMGVPPSPPRPEPPAVPVEQPQARFVQAAPPPVPSQPISPPPSHTPLPIILSLLVGVGGFFVWALFPFLLGIALGSVKRRYFHRKNLGEAMLADTIDQSFTRPHLLLNNVTLPTPEGTTQIDHVLVADTGIFVIETKHYSGWIFGNPQDRQWTQTIYRKKSRFQNPLHQNFGHIKALQSLFDLPAGNFHSVVVFTADASFKTDLGPDVLRLADLIPFLNRERPTLFDERKMAYIVGRIEMKRARRSLETDEYHVNHVHSRRAGQPAQPNLRTVFQSPSGSMAPSRDDARFQPKG